MKHLYLFLLLFSMNSFSQVVDEFTVDIVPMTIPTVPGVHSYSWGVTDDFKWVILGGRVDGLHQRQPFASFLEQDNNKFVFVIDPVNEQFWQADLSVLSASLFEQLQSTNQQFQQRDSMLYITGGYGYSTTAADHITHPYLTAVSLNELADAVVNGNSITPYFRQTYDLNFKVTGGQLSYLDSVFYLVGGNLFDGRYNPQGPDFGPGFVQVYTNDIRAFKIADDGTNLNVYDYVATHDTVNLHRRDYNMVPQIFPDGSHGFTAFSGVFNYDDTPYLNTVDITPGNYTVNSTFSQYLSQYHSAKLPIFDADGNAMHTLFFGGLSQFTLDAQNNLVEDINVPFVKTISRVTRFSNGSMSETDLNYIEMPTLVGPGAEFIPVPGNLFQDEILLLNDVPDTNTLVGYIYGGIESTAENIFMSNDGTQSFASNVIFKVYINKSQTGFEEIQINGPVIFDLEVFPNPVVDELSVKFNVPEVKDINIVIYNVEGAVVERMTLTNPMKGDTQETINVSQYPSGSYIISVSNGLMEDQLMFVKK